MHWQIKLYLYVWIVSILDLHNRSYREKKIIMEYEYWILIMTYEYNRNKLLNVRI